MSSVLVGVDSGGTRTNVSVVVDDGSQRRHAYELEITLSDILDVGGYGASLRKILAPLESFLLEMDVNDLPIHVFISSAAFTPWTRDQFIAAMRDVCPMLANGRIVSAGAANDAVCLLLGLAADGVVVAGTGSSVIIRSSNGEFHQTGGQNWVASDHGSGFWIGLLAIREAFRDLESGVNSVLLQRLRQLYGIRPDEGGQLISRLRDLAIADSNMKKEIARFAAMVCAAAERGDQSAQDIVKDEAETLADMVAGALRRWRSAAELDDRITLVQCGSVLGNDFYRNRFEAQVEMRLTGIEHHATIAWKRMETATEAAVNLARTTGKATENLSVLDLAFRPTVVRW